MGRWQDAIAHYDDAERLDPRNAINVGNSSQPLLYLRRCGEARQAIDRTLALDPNNPRSIVYQLARIEAHLAAMPKRDDSLLTPPEQIAIALATKMRTADVAAVDEEAMRDAQATLIRLSDTVASTYFTTRERSEAPWESLG